MDTFTPFKSNVSFLFSCRYDSYNIHSQKVTIALVGKYTKLSDSYISVVKALKHAALSCRQALDLKCVEADLLEEQTKETDPSTYHASWQIVCAANGIIVPGGFGSRGTEGKILAAGYARTKKVPYLGEGTVVVMMVFAF